MSLNEGKDNLAYRNYKMSDDFKQRMLSNYKQMLNQTESNTAFNNVSDSTIEDSKIVSFNEVETRRNIKDIEKSKSRNFDGLIKVCVASFAIIASIGAIKIGVDSYKTGNKTKKMAKESVKTDGIISETKTNVYDDVLEDGDSSDDVMSIEVNESDLPTLYPDCYDGDGQLLDGYEIRTIKAESLGEVIETKVVGRDFVEISEDEYVKNKKESGQGEDGVEGFRHVYYLQGNKFCRTSCFEGFPTEVYSLRDIEHIEKRNGKVYVYTKKPGQFGKLTDDNLPNDEYFFDYNMVVLTKYAIVDGDKVSFIYSKERKYIENSSASSSYDSINLYIIDDKDTLWYFEDVDESTIGSKFEGDKNCTYTYKKGKNFKQKEIARHVKFDSKMSSDKNIYVDHVDDSTGMEAISDNELVKYKGIDY